MIWGGWYGLPVPNPKIAVDLFMIISGYLMALNANIREAHEPLGQPFSWVLFWIRRYLRLAPAYYLALILVVCFSAYYLDGYTIWRELNHEQWQRDTVYDPRFIHFTYENLLLHISFLFGLLPQYSFSTFLPDWSLSLEMQFYAAFPFIYLGMRKYGCLKVSLTLTLFSIIFVYVLNKIAWLKGMVFYPEPSLLFIKLPYFLIGIILYEIGFNRLLSVRLKKVSVSVVIFLCLYQVRYYGKDVLVLCSIVIAILAIQNQNIKFWPVTMLRRVLSGKIAHIGSDASYAVYLFHGFFISLSGLIIDEYPFFQELSPLHRVILLWVFVSICSYLVSYLVFNYVEKPGINFGKRLIRGLLASKNRANEFIEGKQNLSLKAKSIRAAIWSSADLFFRQGAQFVVGVTLARLLSPEEFGTIALLYLFIGIAGVFIDSGFSSALVKKRDASHIDESTVFWINLAMGVLVAGLLTLIAPLMVRLYGYPILLSLTQMLACGLFINSLGSIHLVMLNKQLNFKKPMMITVVSSILSGSVAIFLAYKGFGVWALAWQSLIASFCSTVMLWLVNSWRPLFRFSFASARELFGFGSYLMLSALLDIAYNRIYSLLIGKFYGVSELAFYNRADNTKQIPTDILSLSLNRVAFPIFSAAADDKAKLLRGTRLAIRLIMLINIPMMLGLMVAAENVVLVLFGEQWRQAAQLLEILCLAGVFWPLHVINLNVLKALGYSGLFFRLEVVKKVIGASLLALGMFYGVVGLAWSQAAFGLVAFFINAYYTRKYLHYGPLKQIADFSGILLISILMGYVVFEVGTMVHLEIWKILAVQVLSGVSIFLMLSKLTRLKAFAEMWQMLRRKESMA